MQAPILAISGIRLHLLGLGLRLGRVVHAVGAVDLFRDQLDALPERRAELIEELEVVLLVAGINDRVGELERSVAALFPVPGQRHAGAGRLGEPAHGLDLVVRVSVEGVDADHRVDARLLHGLDVVDEVVAALLDPAHVLAFVLRGHGFARHRDRARRRGT